MKMQKKQKLSPRAKAILHCKIILFISRIKYPKIAPYVFPTYLLLKYIKLVKSKRPFKLKPVPRELLLNMLKRNPMIDINNAAIVNLGFYKAILNSSEYVLLNDGDKQRLVQIFGGNVSEGDIVISDTLGHNLLKMEFSMEVKICPVDLTQIKIADEVEISLNTMQQSILPGLTDLLLKNYFKNPKLLYKNDTIVVNLKECAPDYFYTNMNYNGVDVLFFKCNKIVNGSVYNCVNGYFCVMGASALKQVEDIQDFLPKKEKIMRDRFIEEDDVDRYLLDSCPDGLKQYVEALERGIRPFIIHKNVKINPMFLVQGPKGSGKHLIVNSLASKLGLKLYKITSTELSSQGYAQAEVKIRNAFFQCKMCSPCIVLINNFEHVCKNNEGQHDPRIINYFKTELDTLFSKNEQPVVLICSSNTKELPSELGRIFLENVKVYAPNQIERKQILEWILVKKCLLVKTNLELVAGKTHGFLYEDLDALVYYAKKNMVYKSQRKNGALEEIDFEAALDVMQSNYTESLGAPKVPKVQWSDVGGLDEVKHEIIKTINLPLKYPELFKSGLKRSGILLYGPPGTGKTLIAKAVATECGLCFLSVKGPELLNMYVGQSEQNVREVFERARQAAPCIIFFDELDSLAPNRGNSGDSGGVMDRVVSQLLSEMDGLNQNGTLFVIGATNRPDLIDPALLRPGRFDKLLYVGPCTDVSSKVSVLKALTRNFNLSDKLSIERVVKTCPDNITGADFYGICSNAWMLAASRLVQKIETGKLDENKDLTHKNVVVTLKDFEESIKAAKPSISPADLIYFEKLKKELSAK